MFRLKEKSVRTIFDNCQETFALFDIFLPYLIISTLDDENKKTKENYDRISLSNCWRLELVHLFDIPKKNNTKQQRLLTSSGKTILLHVKCHGNDDNRRKILSSILIFSRSFFSSHDKENDFPRKKTIYG